jgi:hypothetical protein
MGTIRGTQGAKELAILNKNLNRNYDNKLNTMWIDVKKAFDSIDHVYLMKTLKDLKLPEYVVNFVNKALKEWKIDLIFDRKSIGKVKIERGILQGDNLSLILFVLCLEFLSRKLKENFPRIKIKQNEEDSFSLNHFIFIDDIKMFAVDENVLKNMVSFSQEFLRKTGLEVNKNKYATNTKSCEEFTNILGANDSYKYLGVLEDYRSNIRLENKERIKNDVYERIIKLCNGKLNSVNLFRSLNEYAISKLNYYIGLIDFEPKEFQEIDLMIRRILIKHKIHFKPACLERQYMSRKEFGRGLENVNHKVKLHY